MTDDEAEYQEAVKRVRDSLAAIDNARDGARSGYPDMAGLYQSECGRLIERARVLVGLLR